MRILTVITARGGSEQLPGKNILPFNGVPLLAHTIIAAQQAGDAIGQLILSTDNEKIADVGRKWGVEVPFMRPEKLATANSASLPVLQHAVTFMEQRSSLLYDWVLLLQPTSPLRTGDDILAAIKLAHSGRATAVISVTSANECHPKKLKIIKDGVLGAYDEEPFEQMRRQDFPESVFRTNGAIYLTRRDVVMDKNSFYGSLPLAYIMPPERSIDVDSRLDFIIAEYLFCRGRTDGYPNA